MSDLRKLTDPNDQFALLDLFLAQRKRKKQPLDHAAKKRLRALVDELQTQVDKLLAEQQPSDQTDHTATTQVRRRLGLRRKTNY